MPRNIEIFYRSATDCRAVAHLNDEEPGEPGWYYWHCLPGCLPDSDAFGPFANESEAHDHATGWMED